MIFVKLGPCKIRDLQLSGIGIFHIARALSEVGDTPTGDGRTGYLIKLRAKGRISLAGSEVLDLDDFFDGEMQLRYSLVEPSRRMVVLVPSP